MSTVPQRASAYLTLQMMGTHGFPAAGLIMLGIWSAGICVAGAHSHSLPMWLCVVGLVAALRLVMLMAGPLMTAAAIDLPGMWLASIALIPLGMLWWAALGVVLLVRSRRNHEQPPVSPAP
ncbi:hypothetical protein IWX63_002912 [Arthrobacter sp. CAN_A2]